MMLDVKPNIRDLVNFLLCTFLLIGSINVEAKDVDQILTTSTKPIAENKTKLTIITPPANAVASAHPIATQAGIDILKQGGNAFDAAVAVSATLAVVEPYSSGIGGGGFWLLHRASDNKQVMIDGRERAPLASTETMYQDQDGNVIPKLSVDGPLAAGIPGEPAALAHIAKQYGKLTLQKSLLPAIKAAREGFEVDAYYQSMAKFRRDVLAKWTDSAKSFLDEDKVPEVGYLIKQADLGDTLQAMADQGRDGFYKGKVAKQLVESVREAGGIWTEQDLAEYQVIEREPVKFTYKDNTIISASPPSSGGIALATMMNILSAYKLESLDKTTRTHLIVEAMRRAYRDRAEYLGDSDFVDIPKRLTHPIYAEGLRASIRKDKAMPSSQLPGRTDSSSGFHTTHFSILDKDGNRVSATLSVNFPFGSGYVAEGTGVLLNDEMDDFSAKPGVPNVYGLVGAKANAIKPGKRPLSSMSPTFVESKDGVAILGTPGGSRIITMVLLGILEADSSTKPESWVSLPRFHHQYLPDRIEFEKGAFDKGISDELKQRGHDLKEVSSYGNMQAVFWDYKKNLVEAASDPRGVGLAVVEKELEKDKRQ